jgi:hypothetical protein
MSGPSLRNHRVFLASALQRSEQYLTSAQFLAQLLRQVMVRPHCTHGLLGRPALLPLKSAAEVCRVTGVGRASA